MRPVRYKSRRLMYRDLILNPDQATKRFIKIVTSDSELDFLLERILDLFAVDPPVYDRGYSHHDGMRTR